jgi:hypothetical protein
MTTKSQLAFIKAYNFAINLLSTGSSIKEALSRVKMKCANSVAIHA